MKMMKKKESAEDRELQDTGMIEVDCLSLFKEVFSK